MIKALYRTCSGGARWHDRLFDILQELKFKPSKADHPELDTSELCDEHQTKQFQTLIGQLQWLISLGRFDIAVHVMSLSRFRAQPRKGHLDRAKRIVGYLLFLPDGAIRFRTGEPDFSSLKDQEYDWTRSVYSGAYEQIPHDIPKPLRKHVQTTTMWMPIYTMILQLERLLLQFCTS